MVEGGEMSLWHGAMDMHRLFGDRNRRARVPETFCRQPHICDRIRCAMLRYAMLRHDMTCHDMTRCGMT